MAKRLKKKASKARRSSTTTKSTTRTVVTKRNPSGFGELADYALPGIGGFVASKAISRLAAAQLAKRWPTKAKHVTAGVSIGTFLALWFLGHKWKWLAKYQMPAVVGSAIATVQSLMQLYAPNKLGWLVGDPGQAIGLQMLATQQQISNAQPVSTLPDHLEEISDDPRYYTYNDAYDAGRLSKMQVAAPSKSPPDTIPLPDLDDEDLAAGIFGSSMAPGN